MALGNALAGHQLNWDNGWVKDGNQYFAVASVLRSASISIQGRDRRDAAAGLGVGVATVADVDAKVKVERESESEATYSGTAPLAVAVELYELRWDNDRQGFVFLTPRGPLDILGISQTNTPDPAFIGDDNDALIAPHECG
jgi:hypothetical protein